MQNATQPRFIAKKQGDYWFVVHATCGLRADNIPLIDRKTAQKYATLLNNEIAERRAKGGF
jgi:hypothetical protein